MRLPLLALLIALSLPAVAQAEGPSKIKPNGLGSLRLGMTEEEVEREVGHKINQDKLGGSCGTARFASSRDYLMFTNDRLRRVTVVSKLYETKTGIGVGDPQSDIRKAYGKNVKRSRHAYDPKGYYFSVDFGGRKRIRFETDGSEVTAIHAGRTPEVDYVEGCA